MTHRFTQSFFFYRLGEVFIPVCTWIVILLPVWLSPFHPAIVAYFIIAFNLFFFYKSSSTTYFAVISYKEILFHSKISYAEKIKLLPKAKEIKHYIIVPNYKEPLYKLESTLDSFVQNDYPYKNITLVLAFEKREEEAKEKEHYLREKYSSFFENIVAAYHVLTPNEVQGKASNQTFAAKMVKEFVEKEHISKEDIILTICDADSHLSSNYFSYLTDTYLHDTEKLYHFYWAPVVLYNNFWQLPLFVRMQATLSSIVRLSLVAQKERLIHISTYSSSLWLLDEVGYWDVDIIPEDWHIYFQAFFRFGDKVKTLPLFTIINGDAVYSGGFIKTLQNRYEQEKRWAWGVTDFSYAWGKLFNTPHIPFWVKFRKIYALAETHFLWPTSFFLLTLSASVPPLVNPVFKRTVLGLLLPQISGLILTIATASLLLYIYLDIQVRKKMNIETSFKNLPLLFIQWYLLPIVSFFLSSLPALDAHTRLLLGKKITYKVTEKV
jgi:cellulose synthase/poly-beta-1,6-N-acetylglucosamine synthase-like glycosyltransferase